MTTSRRAVVTLPSDTEILITRTFDAPKHLVYRAWTTPELIKKWWAGERGVMTLVEVDLRVGGCWRYAMTANAGFELVFHGEYREIVTDERIVATEFLEMPGVEPVPAGQEPVTAVEFDEADGQTTIRILTRTASKQARDSIAGSGMEDGTQEQLDRLERLLVSDDFPV
jgi:uncharacterized protein YndB with AHSA1/START domain